MLQHIFTNRNQNQSFQVYFVDIRNNADACELGEYKLKFIRDHIVVGIVSKTARKTYLLEPDLT